MRELPDTNNILRNDNAHLHQVWLEKAQQFKTYRTLIFSGFEIITVTLTLDRAIQFFLPAILFYDNVLSHKVVAKKSIVHKIWSKKNFFRGKTFRATWILKAAIKSICMLLQLKVRHRHISFVAKCSKVKKKKKSQ